MGDRVGIAIGAYPVCLSLTMGVIMFDANAFFAGLNTVPKRMEEVQTPELASLGLPSVWVKEMSAVDADVYYLTLKHGAYTNFRAALICACACDAEGNSLFTNDMVDKVGKMATSLIMRLYEAGQRVNTVTGDAVDEAKKNSGTDPTSD
jgi:hypothetical protein